MISFVQSVRSTRKQNMPLIFSVGGAYAYNQHFVNIGSVTQGAVFEVVVESIEYEAE